MIKIYNTLGRELQVFNSIEEGKVRFYHCGPTVYWTQHIGNFRGMVMADLIRRSLIYLDYEVDYVRNYTDFGHLTGDNIGDADTGEDRMDKAAKKEGISPKEIANKYIKEFEEDASLLNILPPTVTARATDYLNDMVNMVKVLMEKGYAYSTPKAIYFDITKFKDYTKLSGQKIEMNKKGEGHGDVSDPNKKNPQDFALWFFRTGSHANALQFWPSPFESPEVENGIGFPGWHIECSSMVKVNLGDTIDLHMGGIEHIPIHHTNEIAQSESANGVKYVNYWIHNEHLDVDSTKMSKSLGNVYSVRNIVEKGYDPMHLRYFYLQSHYRSKQNFTLEALDASKKAYERLVNFLRDWGDEIGSERRPEFKVDKEYNDKFISAIEDDFNIPQALAVAWDLTKAKLPASVKLDTLLNFDKVFGLKLEEKLSHPIDMEISAEVQDLLDQRQSARENKEWKKSDELRDRLQNEFGLEVKDTLKGQEIRKGK